jgi:protease-4
MKVIWLVCALLAFSTAAGCISVNVALITPPGPLEEVVVEKGKGKDKVLLLDVDGIITSVSEGGVFSRYESPLSFLKERLELAREDEQIKAVVLRVKSPGGAVTACDIMHKELKDFREETGIPIIACFMDVAASGGYYIAMAADQIVCHPTCITGSIGVIAQLATIDKLLDKVGIEPVIIKSGKHKDICSPLRAPTDEEKGIMQNLVNSMYERFVGIVAAGRNMDAGKVRSFADGRVHDANEALKLGLVDKIGYLDDAIDAAETAAGVEDATVVMYQRPGGYRNNVYSAELKSWGSTFSALTSKLLPDLGARFYYLWIPGR